MDVRSFRVKIRLNLGSGVRVGVRHVVVMVSGVARILIVYVSISSFLKEVTIYF